MAKPVSRIGLRVVALGYLAALLLAPIAVILYRTFQPGIGDALDAITTPAAVSAFWLTIEIAAVAVALNTVLGVLLALVLARKQFPGKFVLEAIVDLPFAVSPVVIGLSLKLVYAPRGGWIDPPLQLFFSVPGMILATTFVSLPFVAREVIPVLRELGDEPEQAAATLGASRWQAFWRVTLPSIRWGVAYGVVLATARSLGEFGAVAIVSDKVAGKSLTLPLLVNQRYGDLNVDGAYAAAALLMVIAVAVLLIMTWLNPRKETA